MRKITKKFLSLALCLSMVLSYMPTMVFAAEADGLCDHLTGHTAECGYIAAVTGMDCNHAHDTAVCGYVEAVQEVLCQCTATDDSGALVHTEGCGYVAPVTGADCTHTHDEACGYVAAVEGHECHFECSECAEEVEVIEEETTEVAPVCDCGTDDASVHATNCAVYVAPENPECFCAEKCTEINVWCDVCGFDHTSCTGEDSASVYTYFSINLVLQPTDFVGNEIAGFMDAICGQDWIDSREGLTLKCEAGEEIEISGWDYVPDGYLAPTEGVYLLVGSDGSVSVTSGNAFITTDDENDITYVCVRLDAEGGNKVTVDCSTIDLSVSPHAYWGPGWYAKVDGAILEFYMNEPYIFELVNCSSWTTSNMECIYIQNGATLLCGELATGINIIVKNGTIQSGTVHSAVSVYENGTIAGGTYNSYIYNDGGTITGGTFNGTVYNDGTIINNGAIALGESFALTTSSTGTIQCSSHILAADASQPTCVAAATCALCGESYYGDHDFATAWTTDSEKLTHYYTCRNDSCDVRFSEAACTYVAATCSAASVCSICDYQYAAVDSDAHAWGAYTYSNGKHTRICENDSSHTESDKCTPGADGKCTVCDTQMAASITADGTTTYYATLADAAKVVSEGQTIVMMSDVTVAEGETLAFNAWAVLDAGEHTITCNGTVTIGESAGIIFENALYYDGGDVTNTGEYNSLELDDITVSTYWTAGDGYAIFQPAAGDTSAMLTLHNATIYTDLVGDDIGAIFSKNTLAIRFSGENHLYGASVAASWALNVTGAATMEGIGNEPVLNIWGGSKDRSNVYGANFESDLTINSGTVNVRCGQNNTGFSTALSVGEKLTVREGAVLNCKTSSGRSAGLAAGEIAAEGTVNGISIVDDLQTYAFIYSVLGDVSLTDDLLLTDPYAGTEAAGMIQYTFVVPEGASLTVNEGVTLDLAYLAPEDITITGTITNNGTIKLPADFALDNAPKGGTVYIGEASYTWDNDSSKWICANDEAHTTSAEIDPSCLGYWCTICETWFGEPADHIANDEIGQTCMGYQCTICQTWFGIGNGDNHVKIGECDCGLTAYPIWVSGVQVTNVNKDDVIPNVAGGITGFSAKYDSDTNMLSLKGKFSDLKVIGDINLYLAGAVAIYGSVDVSGTMVTSGTGTLTLYSTLYPSASAIPSGIIGTGTVIIDDNSFIYDSTNEKWVCADESQHTGDANCKTQAECTLCGISYIDSDAHTADKEIGQTCMGYYCTACESWYGEAGDHAFDGTGKCGDCNTQAVATVTIGETITYHLSLGEAITAVKSCTAEDAAVVKLLQDIDLGQNYQVISHTVFTLDLNGHSLSSTVQDQGTLRIGPEVSLTVTDSAGNGSISGVYAVRIWYSSTVHICGGTIQGTVAGIRITMGDLYVSGGTVTGTESGVYITSYSDVYITGGSISGGNVDFDHQSPNYAKLIFSLADGESAGATFPGGISVKGCPLQDLLADGMAYWQGSKMITLTEEQTVITGGDVVIKAACTHADNTNTTATCKGIVCSICGAWHGDAAQVHDTIGSDGNCTLCQTALVASLTHNDTTTYYANADDAFAAGNTAGSGTVTILADADVKIENTSLKVPLVIEDGVTLTLKEYLHCEAGIVNRGIICGRYLTISAGDYQGGIVNSNIYLVGKIISGTFTGFVDNNSGTIEGGTFTNSVTNKSTSCKINGGTFNGDVDNGFGTVSGGTFNANLVNSKGYDLDTKSDIFGTVYADNITLGPDFTYEDGGGTVICETHKHTAFNTPATCTSSMICIFCGEVGEKDPDNHIYDETTHQCACGKMEEGWYTVSYPNYVDLPHYITMDVSSNVAQKDTAITVKIELEDGFRYEGMTVTATDGTEIPHTVVAKSKNNDTALMSFEMPAQNVTLTFEDAVEHSSGVDVTVMQTGEGTVTLPGKAEQNPDKSWTFTVEPAVGYDLMSLTLTADAPVFGSTDLASISYTVKNGEYTVPSGNYSDMILTVVFCNHAEATYTPGTGAVGTHIIACSACGYETTENCKVIYTADGATGTVRCNDCKTDWVTATIIAPACKTYGDGESCEVTAILNDETVDIAAVTTYYQKANDTWVKLDDAPSEAGTYKAESKFFEGNDTTSKDDVIVYVEYTIAKRPITVKADDKSVTYGDTESGLTMQLISGSMVNDDILDVTISREAGTDAGDYIITISQNEGANPNYDITFVNGTYTIKKAVLSVTADSKTVTYGNAEPTLTYTVEGLVNNDQISGELSREAGENVGSYAITQGTLTARDNYTITYTGADLTIIKRAVTITAADQTITYGGTISGTAFTSTGLVDGHTATVTLTPSTANVTVNGSIAATAAVISANGSDVTANYDITYISGKLVIEPDTSKIDDLSTENVTSANTSDIQAVQEMMEKAESIDDAWEDIDDKCSALIEKIEDVEAEQKALTDAASEFDADSVNSTDKSELEQLAKDIDALLETENLTEEERETLETVKEQVEDMLDILEETAADNKTAIDAIDAVDPETVTSDNRDELEQAIDTIDKLLEGDNLTEAEREALEVAKKDAESLLDIIEEAQNAYETENTEKVEDVTSETVKPEDKEALEDAKADLEQALEENSGHLTEEEKSAIEDDIQRIEDAIEALENVEDVTETITKLPETVSPDDETAAEKVLDAKNAYDELTDHEKSLVDETTKKKLDSLVADLTDYNIIKGNSSKWTKSSTNGLTITANGSFSKFICIEIDGKVLNSKYYTAKSGSTIVTLKADYLNSLKEGKHTISVVYSDGSADGTFTVTSNPATGDDSNPALWASLLSISTLSLIALLGKRKRKNVN